MKLFTIALPLSKDDLFSKTYLYECVQFLTLFTWVDVGRKDRKVDRKV